MTNIIKFEQKVEVLVVAVRVGNTKPRIIAFNTEWLKSRSYDQLGHMVKLENQPLNIICEEIGLQECYPSLKGYIYLNDIKTYDNYLAILQNDVNKYDKRTKNAKKKTR